jgi:hypothetical protein
MEAKGLFRSDKGPPLVRLHPDEYSTVRTSQSITLIRTFIIIIADVPYTSTLPVPVKISGQRVVPSYMLHALPILSSYL